MEKNTSPYVCHVFVCVNDRKGARKSCADGNSPAVKQLLKGEFKKRGWQGKVRVSHCGCMGLCMDGPNIILYPQRTWYSGVTEDNADRVIQEVTSIMEDHEGR